MLAARSARKLESIINCILDYTKLESGALVPVYSEIDLEDFLLRCWEPFSMEAHAKGLETRYYLDPDLPSHIRCDASKLGTAIKSLVDNAVKFTDAGHVLLSAERVLSTRDGVDSIDLLIRVSDSGCGIPEGKRQRIFDRFIQVDDSTTRAIGGLGLGLALVKGIADLLDLRLGLSEHAGGGSEFSLVMGLPPDARPAFRDCHDVIRGMRIGLFGNCAAAESIGRWAQRFGAVAFVVDVPELASRAGSTACDVLFADVAHWNRSPKEVREQALALCGGPSGLTLLDNAIVTQSRADQGQTVNLSYPLSLHCLLNRLEALRKDKHGSLPSPCTGNGRGQHDGSLAGQAGTIQDSAYRRLLNDALAEVRQKNMFESLDKLLSQLLAAATASNSAEAERIAKINYDTYTESGAQACARFALALLMDTRRSSDHWLEELEGLAKTVHSLEVEA
jgi:anti-sigma regulatory factor (Ser/Thr protein kinase)